MLLRLSTIAFVLSSVLAMAAFAPPAFADGKMFRTQTPDLSNVHMPDQRAAICFDGTHETLVALPTSFGQCFWVQSLALRT
jgi:hypothetical protein